MLAKYARESSVERYHFRMFSRPARMFGARSANFGSATIASQCVSRHSRVGITLESVGLDSEENVS
jgi:hypothetical protein